MWTVPYWSVIWIHRPHTFDVQNRHVSVYTQFLLKIKQIFPFYTQYFSQNIYPITPSTTPLKATVDNKSSYGTFKRNVTHCIQYQKPFIIYLYPLLKYGLIKLSDNSPFFTTLPFLCKNSVFCVGNDPNGGNRGGGYYFFIFFAMDFL